MDERIVQDARDDGAAGASLAMAEREAGERTGRRGGFADPENWHDLAERGTPRNG